MFHSLERVDWELLHQQKLVLLTVLDATVRESPEAGALWGIVHLLDALQDDAVAASRWAFPDESDDTPAGEPSRSRRYYVEDDEGHHYGPIDDYEEAAIVADAIHGRIIAQAVDCRSAPTGQDGGAREA